jgi:hypothetical protein
VFAGALEGEAAGTGGRRGGGAPCARSEEAPKKTKEPKAKGLKPRRTENRATRRPIPVIASWFLIDDNIRVGIPSAQAGKKDFFVIRPAKKAPREVHPKTTLPVIP